jgi:hypothetical protein
MRTAQRAVPARSQRDESSRGSEEQSPIGYFRDPCRSGRLLILSHGKDLKSLDLANLAVVVGTAAVRAAKGEDWAKVFRPGGPDEYQLYQQAKQRRDIAAEARAAAGAKRKAEAQDQDAHAAKVESN